LRLNLSSPANSIGALSSDPSAPDHDTAHAHKDLEVLRVPQWSEFDWLLHGFSTRRGGQSRLSGGDCYELNLGYSAADLPEAVAANRKMFLQSIPCKGKQAEGSATSQLGLVTLKQMHSSSVRRVGRTDETERALLWGDGLMTSESGMLLGIQTADCLPVLVADRRLRAVAAFHAGWRGTMKRILEKGVHAVADEFGSRPEDLTAAIGPGIGSCCFIVGREVQQLFQAQFSYADELFTPDMHLDLVKANRRQLVAAGLAPEAIFVVGECTSCRTDRYFSYRAERGKTGRMMAVVGIAPN
jgi:YfiH family protein